jgi:hypothetical protein
VAILLSVISAGFAGPTYFNQSTANTAQIQAAQAAATASLERNAERVSYYLGPIPRNGVPHLIIANRSLGTIREVGVYVPRPVHCIGHCGSLGSAALYTGVPDLPPCSIETTDVLTRVTASEYSPWDLQKSALTFTDSNGHRWDLLGSGRLIGHNVAPPLGQPRWVSASIKVSRASGCS